MFDLFLFVGKNLTLIASVVVISASLATGFWFFCPARRYVNLVFMAAILIPLMFVSYTYHVDKVGQLEMKAARIAGDLDRVNKAFEDYRLAVSLYEDEKAKIKEDINTVLVGTDSGTVLKEHKDDPIKAVSDLNRRWGDIDRMFNDATTNIGKNPSTNPKPDSNKTR